MILECPRCQAVVAAKELFSYTDDDPVGPPGVWTFAQCPECTTPLLAVQVDYGDGNYAPCRVFPPEDKQLGKSVPHALRETYNEALVCFRARAFTASAIMRRKTLESLCLEHGAEERTLEASLKKLKNDGVIEERLFEWAEALRTLGNEAAHGVGTTISRQDARDILEFTEALTEYVFTYRDSFDRFKKRRAKKPTTTAGEEALGGTSSGPLGELDR